MRFALILCVTGMGLFDLAHGAEKPAAPRRVFAADSFWYAPIPKDAPLHANSANFAAEFVRQKKKYYGTVSINTTAYASPVYIAAADTPAVKVTEWDCQKKGFQDRKLAEQWAAVPIPAYAEAATGTDAEMTELFGKTPAWALLQNVPWEKLQFLPMDYGKPEGKK